MRDAAVFAAAAGVIAVHALDDAFVSLEAGTGAGDHVVAAAATIGLLVAAVVLYARLRAGMRAVVALVLGVLALEGFAIAAADAASGGPHGDAWTGFLLLPAGVALCGLGATLLWRSRKPTGRRFLRRGLLVVAAVVGAYVVVLPFAVAIVATHRPREASTFVDLGRPAKEVTIRTRDGLDLHARYAPSRNGAAVIVFPASTSRAPQARMFARRGYGVLMLDMRGYGQSEGDPNAFGWGATRDLDAAVAFLAARPDVHGGRIGGIGFSVGGEQLLEAAAGNPALKAVVSEGAGERSIRESLLRGMRGWRSLPTAAVQTAAVAALSGDVPPPALDGLVGRIAPRPVLLIYAGHGVGGEELQPKYYAAARQPKSLWLIPEAHHTGGYAARPAEYTNRVVGFFDQALAP